jgi:hypothetical protein
VQASDGGTVTDVQAYDGGTITDFFWFSSRVPSVSAAKYVTHKMAAGDEADANIKKVAEFVKNERASFNMSTWHSTAVNENGEYPCGTTHCMAGAAVFLQGAEGLRIEKIIGPHLAGKLFLGEDAARYFNITDDDGKVLTFLSEKLGEKIS